MLPTRHRCAALPGGMPGLVPPALSLLGAALVGLASFATSASAVPLTVRVVDAHTEAAVSGAWVMVGEAEDVPFAGNIGTTDGTGAITFDDPVLSSPQTVTIGANGYSFTTLYQAAQGDVTLRLFPTELDPSFGGTLDTISGEVDNVGIVNNDGNVDVSIVLPGVTTETLAFFDPDPFLFGLELVSFPIVGDVLLPENVYITRQIELVFLVFEKTPYTIDVPGNRSTNFIAVSARAAIDELASDPDLSALEIREFGVERNVALGTGTQTLDVNSDINLDSDGITTNFVGVPAGAGLRIVSAALVGTGSDEEILGFATITPNINDGTSWSVAGTNPTGDISDADIVVSGVYQDSSSAGAFAAGILQRGPITVPASVDFDSWMLIPNLSQSGTTLQWSDPTDPGVSPSPTWTRSTLGLRPIDPNDGSVTPTDEWRIYAPASLGSVVLPTLPGSAPGSLSDPDQTPEADELAWSFTAANGSNDPNDILVNFMTEATHWTQTWIPVSLATTSVPGNETVSNGLDIGLRIAPSPTDGRAEISWSMPNDRPLGVQIVSTDGRTLRTWTGVSGSQGLVWDGRDLRDQEVPAGVYWVVARSEGEIVGRQQIVRVR
ncbi:MAG: hypothetical protein KDA27_22755 [Candidatus Eisenbacteria bacterium]|uniref:FlgD Ig-like domain-containing protein n=1 Tax=Eiseniibacteriota bacterium TaxID=2212470 RepID=A0A956NFX4_UNCEI|nr:hypothetical protein [Candidatus Eisenbacteria bacterium]MCB9464110.1 hypothetical protein [Candidatus Eisenbacteria bacterium]